MTEQHEKVQEALQQCLELLDSVSNTVAENRFSPMAAILQNIGNAVGHILHAKKQVMNDNIS